MKHLTASEIKKFTEIVYGHFALHGRKFPWRRLQGKIHPYYVLVSEIMLQQTQADRVISKFNLFVKKFPTIHALHHASTKELILAWQGLGYNRRALALKDAAGDIVTKFGGKIPDDPAILETLSGVGPYTARAIAVFAFNKPHIVIETNIRTVFIHHFFSTKKSVDDRLLEPLIEATMSRENPRAWYSALMDYGAHLKMTVGNISRRSAHYVKQSTFAGSDRELRGKILKEVGQGKISKAALFLRLDTEKSRAQKILSNLIAEGFLRLEKTIIRLSD